MLKKQTYTKEQKQLIDSIEKTRIELETCRAIFDEVTDNILIDYAIYNEEAIKKKYSYLLLQARKSGINLEILKDGLKQAK